MKIALRLLKGWKYDVNNESEYTCDVCGAKLFAAPHGGLYCDWTHVEIIIDQEK